MEVHLEDRDAWRAWLQANHARAGEVWVISWKKATGKPSVPYDDAVEEALCFGWVDGVPATVDGQRTKRRFAPRKPGSPWTAKNRERADRLMAEGRMTKAGREVIDAAKSDGSWTSHDAVERLDLPHDVAAALDGSAGARASFDRLAPHLRRDILEWIAAARQPATRERRIARTVEASAAGEVVRHSRPTRTRR